MIEISVMEGEGVKLLLFQCQKRHSEVGYLAVDRCYHFIFYMMRFQKTGISYQPLFYRFFYQSCGIPDP